MRKINYIYLFIIIPLFFMGCDRNVIDLNKNSFPLEITTHSSSYSVGTKSEVVLGVDDIYAYPFALTSDVELIGSPIYPSVKNSQENKYLYYMPEKSQEVIFSNVISDENSYTVTTQPSSSPIISFSLAKNGRGSDQDLVIGSLRKASISTEDPEKVYPTALKRKVAALTFSLKAKKKDGSFISNLSEYFNKIEVSIPTYSTFSISTMDDAEIGSYSGSITNLWSHETIPSSDSIIVCTQRFIFPSIGSDNPKITVKVTTKTGFIIPLEATMNQVVEQNKHYKLSLIIKQKSSEFGFEVADMQEEEIDFGFNWGDKMFLNITPSFKMNVETKGGFALGTNSLYCYSYSGNKLNSGFPAKESLKLGKDYQYSLPKSNQSLIFSNVNFNKTEGEYYVPYVNSDTGECSLVINSSGYASEGLVLGLLNNVTVDDNGLTRSISLEHYTSKVRILLDIKEGLIDLAPSVRRFWLKFGPFWSYMNINLNNGNISFAFPSVTPNSVAQTPSIIPSNIKTVSYNGKNYYELLDNAHVLINNQYSQNYGIYLDIQFTNGKTNTIYFYHTEALKKGVEHTIVLSVSSSVFEL